MKQVSHEEVATGELIVRSALEALRAYHAAMDDGAPAEEVERLRRSADIACRAVSDFRRTMLDKQPLVSH